MNNNNNNNKKKPKETKRKRKMDHDDRYTNRIVNLIWIGFC